jgi:hypothetical protein
MASGLLGGGEQVVAGVPFLGREPGSFASPGGVIGTAAGAAVGAAVGLLFARGKPAMVEVGGALLGASLLAGLFGMCGASFMQKSDGSPLG